MKPSDAASETPIHFTPLPSRRWAALFALSVDPGARAHLSALHIDEGSLPFRSTIRPRSRRSGSPGCADAKFSELGRLVGGPRSRMASSMFRKPPLGSPSTDEHQVVGIVIQSRNWAVESDLVIVLALGQDRHLVQEAARLGRLLVSRFVAETIARQR